MNEIIKNKDKLLVELMKMNRIAALKINNN